MSLEQESAERLEEVIKGGYYTIIVEYYAYYDLRCIIKYTSYVSKTEQSNQILLNDVRTDLVFKIFNDVYDNSKKENISEETRASFRFLKQMILHCLRNRNDHSGAKLAGLLESMI